jgi:hypothetical protein
MRQPSHAVLQVEPCRAEEGEVRRDLLRDRFWRPDVERSRGPTSCRKDSLVGTANPRVLLGAGRPVLSRSQTAKGSHPRKCLTDWRYSHSMASLRR